MSFCLIAVLYGQGVEKNLKADADPLVGLLEEEAALTVMMLHTENRELREKVSSLEDEVAGLQLRLAEAMARLDVEAGPGASDKRVTVPRVKVPLNSSAELRVLDVNGSMKVAVISGGLRSGMKVGMAFSVLRDEKVIAEIRLIDVRDRVAGGLIEKVISGRFPETGDRLVLRETQD